MVVTARARGADVVAVKVFIDGKLAAERLTGFSLEIDPGLHKFRFESPPWPVIEREVLASEGVKDRHIDVEFAPPLPTAAQLAARAEPKPFRLERSDYVFGGIALAGFVTLGYFGGTGLYDAHQYETTCKPYCSASRRRFGAIAAGDRGHRTGGRGRRAGRRPVSSREGSVLMSGLAIRPRLLVGAAAVLFAVTGCQMLVDLDALENRHCGPDEKACPDGCVPKNDPTTGCALLQCAPCAPPHAKAKCGLNGECATRLLPRHLAATATTIRATAARPTSRTTRSTAATARRRRAPDR